MPKEDTTKSGWIFGLAFAVYAVLLASAERAHTFWRDEAEVWIISRDSHGLKNLLHNVRYEGHPPAWYAVLYPITRFTHNVEWMKVVNCTFALATVAMVLTTKRISLGLKLGFVFSYFILFEYAVIDRNYMMGIMLLVAALLSMKWKDTSLFTPLLLSAAALTSLPALIVAVCFYPLHVLPLWETSGAKTVVERAKALGVKRWFAIAVFSLSVLFAVAIIRPPKDSGLMLDSVPSTGLVKTLVHPFHDLAKGYLPLPVPKVMFWESNIINGASPALFTLLGVVLAVCLCLFFRRSAVRTFFLVASSLLLAQMAVSRRTDVRHVGWLFVVFMLSLLLEDVPWFGAADAIGWRSGFLYTVLCVQVIGGIFAMTVSVNHSFSASKQTALYLEEHGAQTGPLVFAPGYVSLPVLAYMQRPSAYYMETHQQGSIIVWNKAEHFGRHVPSREELQAAAVNGVSPTLVTEKPLSDQQMQQLGVQRLALFSGEIWPDNYFVYR